MKFVVTGAAGLFGNGLTQVLREGHDVAGITRADGDITDSSRMRELLSQLRPDVVVHAAAIPDIDECELHPKKAFRVNAEATRDLARIAEELGIAFALISTDAVFDGKSDRPYVETDPVSPPSVYGQTKVMAEEYVRRHERHWIFRVSVLFGPGKANFVNKGLCKGMGKEPYVVASDQLGSALYTLDGARIIMRVIESAAYGTFHLCNQGECTREELARKAVEMAGLDTAFVIGKPMSEMKRPGPRLKRAAMEMRGLANAGFALPGRWEDALREYVGTLAPGKPY